MNPLVAPGDYNISYNQKYLLEKLYLSDIWHSYALLAFKIILIIIFVIWVIWYAQKTHRANRAALVKSKTAQSALEVKEVFERFHDLCRLIYEDKNVFGRSEKMIEEMYYPELKKVIAIMRINKKILERDYYHLIPDYNYWLNKMAEDKK